MPFCGELTAHFQFFKRCGDLANISVSRVDRDEISSDISESIYRSIRDADLILVDLTGSNPNVLYELGVAHSMGKRVILVADSVDSVPFDIASASTYSITVTRRKRSRFDRSSNRAASSHYGYRRGALI